MNIKIKVENESVEHEKNENGLYSVDGRGEFVMMLHNGKWFVISDTRDLSHFSARFEFMADGQKVANAQNMVPFKGTITIEQY